MIKFKKFKVYVILYKDLLQVFYDFIDAKNAYTKVLKKKIKEKLTKASKKGTLNTLDLDKF
jgi:hypothetical protein